MLGAQGGVDVGATLVARRRQRDPAALGRLLDVNVGARASIASPPAPPSSSARASAAARRTRRGERRRRAGVGDAAQQRAPRRSRRPIRPPAAAAAPAAAGRAAARSAAAASARAAPRRAAAPRPRAARRQRERPERVVGQHRRPRVLHKGRAVAPWPSSRRRRRRRLGRGPAPPQRPPPPRATAAAAPRPLPPPPPRSLAAAAATTTVLEPRRRLREGRRRDESSARAARQRASRCTCVPAPSSARRNWRRRIEFASFSPARASDCCTVLANGLPRLQPRPRQGVEHAAARDVGLAARAARRAGGGALRAALSGADARPDVTNEQPARRWRVAAAGGRLGGARRAAGLLGLRVGAHAHPAFSSSPPRARTSARRARRASSPASPTRWRRRCR